MRVSPVNSQAFKGTLILSESRGMGNDGCEHRSPRLEVDTDKIVEINNYRWNMTDISYINDKSEMVTHTYYHDDKTSYDMCKVLLGYTAAAANENVVIKV